MATTAKRCEGKRHMWRGNKLGTFKCGRKARWVLTTSVGLSRTHYSCGDAECDLSVTQGYPASGKQL